MLRLYILLSCARNPQDLPHDSQCSTPELPLHPPAQHKGCIMQILNLGELDTIMSKKIKHI